MHSKRFGYVRPLSALNRFDTMCVCVVFLGRPQLCIVTNNKIIVAIGFLNEPQNEILFIEVGFLLNVSANSI